MSYCRLLNKLERLLREGAVSRRDFFKYAGILGGVSVAGSALDGMKGKVFADTRPRVVSVHNSDATNWDYVTGYHWDYINQTVVNDMVARGVKALTGHAILVDAWNALIPYQVNDAVVIKINLNNSFTCDDGYDNKIDAYPETVNSVIDGLVLIGVPPEKIWIADPSRVIPDRFINKITNPDVQYYSTVPRICSGNYFITDYVDADSDNATPTTHPTDDVVRPAQVFVDAAHLINIPILKGHGYGHMTLGMKNHYGSVIFKNYPDASWDGGQGNERGRLHEYVEPYINPDIEKSTLADICNNPHIRDKTRLVIGDGLFGNPNFNYLSVEKWAIFNNDDPNILFFGIDPIATDSVMCDYITVEQDRNVIHSSLHHGAALGLGIHEHWDSFETKRYSLIDYLQIDCDSKRTEIDLSIKGFKDEIIDIENVLSKIEQYMLDE